MVELRKRKALLEGLEPLPTEKKRKVPAKVVSKRGSEMLDKQADTSPPGCSSSASAPSLGDTIHLDGFGGEVKTNEDAKTTLKALVDASNSGVVLFTYPKASTPGCTKQVCLFRDGYNHLTSTGLSIYGLSTDSPKANTMFKTKQKLPYPLLCDRESTLITALGFKKVPKGTIRGVFAVDKAGKVLLLEAGGPATTVDSVQGLVAARSHEPSKGPATNPEGQSSPTKP